MKISDLIIINWVIILTALSGCLESKAVTPSDSPCLQLSPNSIKLSGVITAEMQDCAAKTINPRVDNIIVNSKGGDVDAGRTIGYLIGARPRTVIVERYCLSSCGNYFIPPANLVTLKDGAVIGLHGSPDPHMLSSRDLEKHLSRLEKNGSSSALSARRQLAFRQERRDHHLAEETKFASTFKVPKGWRHYREINDASDGWRQHFEDGTDKNVVPDRFMIVEEEMIASCLPHIKLNNYQYGLETHIFQSLKWKQLKDDIGAYRSLGLKCRQTPDS